MQPQLDMHHLTEDTPLLKHNSSQEDRPSYCARIRTTVRVCWHLGFVAFEGRLKGTAEHLEQYFKNHAVRVHEWLNEEDFDELHSLCRVLPGQTSTQLLVAAATTHAGILGGAIAFFLWSLPGCIILTLTSIFLYDIVDPDDPPIWLVGMPPAAVALILKSFAGLGEGLDALGVGIGVVCGSVSIIINNDERIPRTCSQYVYPLLLLGGAITALADSRSPKPIGTYPKPRSNSDGPKESTIIDRKLRHKIGHGVVVFLVWLILLVGSSLLLRMGYQNIYLQIFEIFFRIGCLVFGDGIVIIPMLQNEVVANPSAPISLVVPMSMTNDQFFQGLGLAQSLPGPFSNFAAFIGGTCGGLWGAIVASAGLFAPGFLLLYSILPFWDNMRQWDWLKAVIQGLNASAIGLVGGACVFLHESSVTTSANNTVFVICGTMVGVYGFRAYSVIVTGCLLGAVFAAFDLGQISYEERE